MADQPDEMSPQPDGALTLPVAAPGTAAPYAAPQSFGAPSPVDTPDTAAGLGWRWMGLRREIPRWQAVLLGLLCVGLCYLGWWYVTHPNADGERILSRIVQPSPGETFEEFHSLWFDQTLALNALASLKRVASGFALALLVGVPLGVMCGCFPWFNSFLAPITIFGRNIPLAALIPLTLLLFGTGELQSTMFIFVASVAFVIIDTATSIINVHDRYIDTAYTLSASRWQVITKVLFPLALPSIFDSARLLFGLAFGYIMLAEVIRSGGGLAGLGGIISVAQHQGPREYITLILLFIPVMALVIDRFLFWVQRQLFPYRYGGSGYLHQALRAALRTWEDFSSFFLRSRRSRPHGLPPANSGGSNSSTSSR